MSITLKNNKIIIQNEVDLTDVIDRIEKSESSIDHNSINREIKRKILENIEYKLEKAIVSKLNLEQKIEQGDWSKYEKAIDEKIETKIKKVVEEKVQKEIDNIVKASWGNSKLEEFITQSIEKNFTESIHPKISKLMEKMISINPVEVDNLIEIIEDNAKSAYDAAYYSR